jgi:hypothetical protein
MNRARPVFIGAVVGLVLSAQMAWAADGTTLNGKGHLGIDLQSELISRQMKLNGQHERERVTRETVRLSYGLADSLDLFALVGTGNVTFEEADLGSHNRPVAGLGVRSSVPFADGYYTGFSLQVLAGQVSKFDQGGTTVSIEDKWNETDAAFFVGTKDLIRDPEPDLRFYTGVKFSTREDKLTPQGGSSSTAKAASNIGVMLGMSFSDRRIFRFDTEIGTGDSNNIMVRLGLLF